MGLCFHTREYFPVKWGEHPPGLVAATAVWLPDLYRLRVPLPPSGEGAASETLHLSAQIPIPLLGAAIRRREAALSAAPLRLCW